MNIRILIDARQLGGVETHVMNLCEELCRRNHDCKIVFMCHYPNSILYSACERKKINYISCKSYKELINLLNKEKPNIVHAHGYKANIFSRIYGLLTRTPVVTTFHSGEKPIGRLILYNFLDRWSSFLSKNICVNAKIAKRLPSDTQIIPNFVEVPFNINEIRTTPPFQIYFIGRVSPEKGPLRFCQLAQQSSKDYIWHMVGTGPLLKNCQKDYQNCVHFHRAVTNMEALWPKVDLLCITSTFEGLPLVLLEAMSRGIPVVSFNVGSVQKVISDPKYIIENYDLQRMQECINSNFSKTIKERGIMADKARNKIISTFSKEIVVPQIIDIYSNYTK